MLSKNPQEVDQVFTLSIFAIVIMVIMAIAKNRNYFKLSYKKNLSPLNFSDIFTGFFLYALINITISPFITKLLIYIIFPADTPSNIFFISFTNISNNILITSALYLYPLFRRRKKFKSIWKADCSSSSYFNDAKIGFLSLFIAFPVVTFFSNLTDLILSGLFNITKYTDQSAIEYVKLAYKSPMYFSIAIVTIIIFAPLIEEFLFRGLLQNFLGKFFKTLPRIVLTSLCFSLIHCNLQQGYNNIIIFVSIFILSLFLGFIYERQKSLLSPIVLHAAFNSLNFFNLIFFKDL